MIFLSLIDIDCKKDILFLFTFEKELPDDAFEDDVYDDILVGCAAKVITWCDIQDENGFMQNI